MVRKMSVMLLLITILGISLIHAGGSRTRGVEAAEVKDISQLPKNNQGYMEISAKQLRSLLTAKDFLLVNVNAAATELIPDTDFTVPFDEIEGNLDRFPSQDQTAVLYCQAGGLSRSAAKDLVKLGFANVVWLTGGINAWKRAGYDVEAK